MSGIACFLRSFFPSRGRTADRPSKAAVLSAGLGSDGGDRDLAVAVTAGTLTTSITSILTDGAGAEICRQAATTDRWLIITGPQGINRARAYGHIAGWGAHNGFHAALITENDHTVILRFIIATTVLDDLGVA